MGILKCIQCGQKFMSTGYEDDKWCSTECYLKWLDENH